MGEFCGDLLNFKQAKNNVKERQIKGRGHRQEVIEAINFSPQQLPLTTKQDHTG